VSRTALLAGASGLVGGCLLDELLQNATWGRVVALVRRELRRKHARLVQRYVDYARLDDLSDVLGADDVFCCLGTTMKKASSRAAFSAVDFTYVHELARAALAHGATQFLLVSALGANPRSRIFYSRVKGEVEEAVGRLPYRAVHIFRPSFLLGERTERRPGERIGMAVARVLSPLLIRSLCKYRPIQAGDLARAMVRAALTGTQGIEIWEYVQLTGPVAPAQRAVTRSQLGTHRSSAGSQEGHDPFEEAP